MSDDPKKGIPPMVIDHPPKHSQPTPLNAEEFANKYRGPVLGDDFYSEHRRESRLIERLSVQVPEFIGDFAPHVRRGRSLLKQHPEEDAPIDLHADVTRWLSRFSLRNFPFPVRITLAPLRVCYEQKAMMIRVLWMVVERDAPYGTHPERRNDVSQDIPIPAGVVDEQTFYMFIRRVLYEVATHEVDEAIHFSGERVFDPHDRDKSQARYWPPPRIR